MPTVAPTRTTVCDPNVHACTVYVWAHNPAAFLGVVICLYLLGWWGWNRAQNLIPYKCRDCGGDLMRGKCTCDL